MPSHTQSPVADRNRSEVNNDDYDTSPGGKRKSSASAHDPKDDDGENGKKKRRKVNHACVYCRRSHMTCDLQRPCARCVKRDIGHLCHDEPRDPPKRSKSEIGVAEIAPAPDSGEGIAKQDMGVNGGVPYPHVSAGDIGMGATTVDEIVQPTPVSPTQLQRPAPNATANNQGNFLQNFDWNNNGMQNQFQDMHHLHPNYMFNTSEVTNEYNLLNDFLSTAMLDDGALYNNDDAQALFNDPLLSTSSVNALSGNLQQHQQPMTNTIAPGQAQLQHPSMPAPGPPPPQTQAGQEISRPNSAFPISEQSRNKFYMTAADPAGLSSAEDRLHKLLQAKYDAGMLKPFNYVKGYARLNSYMSKNMSRESQVRILKQLDRFRPKFREAMKNLTDIQLVIVEMWFERTLMEYDRVFSSMAIPACCWRRTGEIFRGNREMAELIGVPWEKLRDGKLAIHEIIAEDSLVSYWEKFGAIAFDQSQKAILTSCALKTPVWEDTDNEGSTGPSSREGGGEKGRSGMQAQGPQGSGAGKEKKQTGETVKCCFSFTIRRDTYNM